MGSSTSSRGIAAIVGVGPKLGRSIARKFAHEGYTVAILARDLGMYYILSLSLYFFTISSNWNISNCWVILQVGYPDLRTRLRGNKRPKCLRLELIARIQEV